MSSSKGLLCVLVGFWCLCACLEDDIVTWVTHESKASSFPPARAKHSAVLMTNGLGSSQLASQLYVFGGVSANSVFLDDLWKFSTDTGIWTEVTGPIIKPAARAGHSANLVGRRMFIYGGKSLSSFLTDVSIYHIDGSYWTTLVANATARAGHCTVRRNQEIIVFGGLVQSDVFSSDLLFMDTATGIFTQPVTSGVPPQPREGHTMTAVGDKLYVYGGYGAQRVRFSDVHVYDVLAAAWTQVFTIGRSPLAREGHSAVLLAGGLWVFGGLSAGGDLNDLHRLDMDTHEWTSPLSVGVTPPARSGHAAVAMGSQMLLLGGSKANSQYFDDVLSLVFGCSGSVTLVERQGVFSDGSSVYSNDAFCEWVIRPNDPNTVVSVSYISLETERDRDLVRFYDGHNSSSPLLVTHSGQILPQPVVSSSRVMTVQFTSDGANSQAGFSALYATLCSPGYVLGTAADACVPCPPGTFTSHAGATRCSPCSSRHYQPEEGSSSCLQCPDFSKAATEGAAHIDACFCEYGYVRRGDQCLRCPAGARCQGGSRQSDLEVLDGWCLLAPDKPQHCCPETKCFADKCPTHGVWFSGESTHCFASPFLNLDLEIFASLSAAGFVVVVLVSCITGYCCGSRSRRKINSFDGPSNSLEKDAERLFEMRAKAKEEELAVETVVEGEADEKQTAPPATLGQSKIANKNAVPTTTSSAFSASRVSALNGATTTTSTISGSTARTTGLGSSTLSGSSNLSTRTSDGPNKKPANDTTSSLSAIRNSGGVSVGSSLIRRNNLDAPSATTTRALAGAPESFGLENSLTLKSDKPAGNLVRATPRMGLDHA